MRVPSPPPALLSNSDVVFGRTPQDNDYFLGGLGLTGTALFNWHPVLMVSGMIVAYTQGETTAPLLAWIHMRTFEGTRLLPTAVEASHLLYGDLHHSFRALSAGCKQCVSNFQQRSSGTT